jgi:hypothetical protein
VIGIKSTKKKRKKKGQLITKESEKYDQHNNNMKIGRG